uniref:Uncharacterized protein n=1 Tax=Tanacetum cinerariifolium TaxID=118510 RepID=A0A6L2LWK2_TANCI|nr:hypothetical protein [Tanacetum cinerariifolium]
MGPRCWAINPHGLRKIPNIFSILLIPYTMPKILFSANDLYFDLISHKSQTWGPLANSETKIISASPPPTDSGDNQHSKKAILGEELASISTKRPLLQDMQAPTPAMINQNDMSNDDEAEPLNENDDDDNLDDVG